MDPIECLESLGGLASRKAMMAAGVSPAAISRAVAAGRIARVSRALYGWAVSIDANLLALIVTGGVASYDDRGVAARHGDGA